MKSFTPIILIIVSLGLFFMHISPRYDSVKRLMEQEDQYNVALQKAEELSSVRDQLLAKYNSFSEVNINRLNRLVPDRVNTVKLVADIDSVAGNHGLTLSNIKVVEEKVDDSNQIVEQSSSRPYLTTSVSFDFSSTYENLVGFIQELERSLQMIDITSISFRAADDSSRVFKYTANINTYWLKP